VLPPPRVIAVALAAVHFGGSPALAAKPAEAPVVLAAWAGQLPITNKQNQILYIVDLIEGVDREFPDVRDPRKKEADDSKFQERHPNRTKNMIEAFQAQYDFEYQDMTSWVGLSFTTYLNAGQLQKIRRDPRVSLVTEVTTVEFSQSPPWSNSPLPPTNPPTPNPAPANFFGGGGGSEISSWGRVAVNGKVSTVASSLKTRVYVLDSGVGNHADLNVMQRVNPSCSTNGANCIGLPSIGCYAHGTHVAGIIGAKNSGVGVRGVNAGAPIYSVSLASSVNNTDVCADRDPNTVVSALLSGLDWIKYNVATTSVSRIAVVNLSLNGQGTGFPAGQTFINKVAALNNAVWLPNGLVYPKIFFVHAAGNNATINACEYAYSREVVNPEAPTTTMRSAVNNDGVMVVGAHDQNGNIAASFSNPLLGGNTLGSNFGMCVDVYAPGTNIWSTWSDRPIPSVQNGGNQKGDGTIYNHYGTLGGTSMAAPHIAGVAAWLAETQNPATVGALELLVRGAFVNGASIPRVRLP
jgi:hypothetical protein